MKIVVFHNLPAGGAKRSLDQWLSFIKKNNSIDFYGYNDLSSEFCNIDQYFDNNFKLYKNPKKGIGILNKILALTKSEYYSYKISKIINSKKYDLAFVLQCEITNSPPILRKLKVKKYYYCQEPLTRMKEPHYHSGNGKKITSFLSKILVNFLVMYDKLNASYADVILTNSYYSKEVIYKAYGIYPKLIYLGVNAEIFKEFPNNTKSIDYVLSVGHLNSAKGHDFIIESLSFIEQNLRPTLKIVYNIENLIYKSFLINFAKDKGVRLILIKSPSDSELIDIYNNAYLLLCAARLEPLGLSPLEAMSCGTPVVSVAEAGYRETIIEGEGGVLVERIPKEMATAVVRLLSNRNEYLLLKSKCRKYVINNWLWEYSSDELSKQFEFIC